jgi:MFS family permease
MSLLFHSSLNSTRVASGGRPAACHDKQHRLALAERSHSLRVGSVTDDTHNRWDDDTSNRWKYLYVLPVLLLEFLALALTRAVLPSMLMKKYGSSVYIVMGCADCIRGSLAFIACPIFGKVSDIVGRRMCLLITVLGTCIPVCSLAFFPWTHPDSSSLYSSGGDATMLLSASLSESVEEMSESSEAWSQGESSSSLPTSEHDYPVIEPYAITVFIILLSLSGVFSSTFTLVFAYISDTVKRQDERVSAYGLALATFGLSFTIGPMAGGYLAKSNPQLVFRFSLLLTLVDLLYIYFILPESRKGDNNMDVSGSASIMTMDHNFSWNPMKSLQLVLVDPFLRKVGQVAFLYYTGLWAIISTLSLYAVRHFHLSPERLGELMSALGLSTMVAEAVLVRIMVPMLGEKQSMKLGLLSFGIQCVILGFAYESWHLFVCAFFSMLGNLVYPSLSSLVSGSVEPDSVGEALGALNGIKALTEGVGPLLFGTLMTWSEKSAFPGWPYLLAAVLVFAAYKATDELPDIEHDDYIHELDKKIKLRDSSIIMRILSPRKKTRDEDELEGLLSEIDDSDEEEESPTFAKRPH